MCCVIASAGVAGSVSYLPNPEKFVANARELGQQIAFEILVANNGPSIAPLSQLSVVWPLFSPLQSDQFFLYPVEIETVSGHIKECLLWFHYIRISLSLQPPQASCDMRFVNFHNFRTSRRKRQSSDETDFEIVDMVGCHPGHSRVYLSFFLSIELGLFWCQ